MELDKRIIEGKTYLDCFDTEVAKGFIGKECYLSDGVASFANVDNLNKAVLIEVDDENIKPYTLENIRWRYSSNFILPVEWVKEPENEKKYRPFTLNEFLEKYDVGDLVKIRRNGYEEVEHAMFTGYITGPDESGDKNLGEYQIIIGGMRYSFAYLFEYYELFFMGHWQPFGMIDEDKE